MDQCGFRSRSISNPNVRNFGRSLLAGYCPTYMPDLVLHGTSSDEKLKQCLAADLVHTVHVSDPSSEPLAAHGGWGWGAGSATGAMKGLLIEMQFMETSKGWQGTHRQAAARGCEHTGPDAERGKKRGCLAVEVWWWWGNPNISLLESSSLSLSPSIAFCWLSPSGSHRARL